MPATATLPTAPASSAPIKVRRINFDVDGPIDRHFMNGDLVMSHVVAVLSSLFPEGEDFFVQSVRNYRDRIDDPVLRKDIAGFIGQEAIHGREHRALNERLGDLGYPTRLVDRFTRNRLSFEQRHAPEAIQLAVTAALEHYTATLAEILLGDAAARAEFGDNEVQHVLLWHAVEESEHKAVAFDVFQAVVGNDRMRRWVMNVTTVGFLGTTTVFAAYSIARDPAARDLRRLGRSLARLRHSPWLSKEARRRIRDYNRPDFHPSDHDATALLDEWRDRLFGAEGKLVDRLAG